MVFTGSVFVRQVTCHDDSGATPLHLACRAGHVPMVEMLIENGAPVNIISTSNYAPVHLAARAGQCQCK